MKQKHSVNNTRDFHLVVMVKLILTLLFSVQVQAADFVFTFETEDNSIDDSKVSQISTSKITGLQAAINNLSPVGTINTFVGSTAPEGWLFLHGQSLSTTQYPQLFALIGYTYGGSGGNFNLPDTRGLFIRSAGSQSLGGITYSGSVGAKQTQDWKSFTMTNTVQNGYNYSHNDVYMGKTTSSYTGNIFSGRWAAPAAALGLMWDGSENRPANISFNYMIKH